MDNSKLSVLIPVHHSEVPKHLDTALESVFEQICIPEEVILVRDANLRSSGLQSVIDDWFDNYSKRIQQIEITTDHTLGEALQTGLEACSHEIVARMDSDDISVPSRLKKQATFLSEHPDIDVVGSYLAEFESNPDNPHAVRTVSTSPEEIRKKARFRNPMNHPTVMFRKRAVIAAGGYRNINAFEDYDLWARMLLNGFELANLPEPLVKARAGEDLHRRRGGLGYAYNEYEFQRELYENGFLTLPSFLRNLVTRLPVRLLPNRIRGLVYSTFVRR